MFEWRTASNAIYLGEDEGGKGRQFKARFLVPGLVKYDYGVCLLTKENADKFINGFTGCPVVINHQTVTDKNVKDVAVGDIFSVWFDEKDGYYWCNGILRDKEAIKLIDEGYSVSCQYLITEYSDNTSGKLHNGNPYDKIIENGKPEHLAIVNNPRYEGAIIAVNAIMATNEDHWITIHPNGEENKGRHLLIKDGESVEDAMHRNGWYKKRQAKEEKKESILDTIAERDKQAKELKEGSVLKDLKMPKTFEERQQEDIDKGELVELGKFPTKFTSKVKEGFSGDSQKPLKQEKNLDKETKTIKKDDELVDLTEDYYNRISEDELKKEFKDIQKEFIKWKDKKNTSEYKDYKNKLLKIKDIYEKRFGKTGDKQEQKQSDTKDGKEEKYEIPKDYKDSVKGYSKEKHEQAADFYGEKMATVQKKSVAHPDNEDYRKQFEEYKALKDYHEEKAKSDSKGDLDIKKTTVKMKSGKEKEIEYVDDIPKGYKKLEGAMTAPLGYTWYSNGKSVIDKERKTILVKDKANNEQTASNNLITTDELFVTEFKDTLYTALAEGIVNRLGE